MLVAHGSRTRPAAAVSTLEHAERLRRSGLFAEVAVGFLDGDEPLVRAAARMHSQTLYVVPLLMADGRLASETIPGLLAETWRATPPRQRIVHCEPVGTARELSAIIATRATMLCRAERWRPGATSVLLIGHGSRQRPSAARQTAVAHARRVAKTGSFAAVDVAFLSEPPSPAEWLCERDGNVVAIGLFIGAGGHAKEDVPRALERVAPWRLGRVVYGGPIGGEPRIAHAILVQARRATLAGQDNPAGSRAGHFLSLR